MYHTQREEQESELSVVVKQQNQREKFMKKDDSKKRNDKDEDMLPEYDFRGGVRGKHYKAYRQGFTVTIHNADGTKTVQEHKPEKGTVKLEPDVQEYFPDAEAVNETLRCLIPILKKKNEAKVKA